MPNLTFFVILFNFYTSIITKFLRVNALPTRFLVDKRWDADLNLRDKCFVPFLGKLKYIFFLHFIFVEKNIKG